MATITVILTVVVFVYFEFRRRYPGSVPTTLWCEPGMRVVSAKRTITSGLKPSDTLEVEYEPVPLEPTKNCTCGHSCKAKKAKKAKKAA
jgi:hypothetical protein